MFTADYTELLKNSSIKKNVVFDFVDDTASLTNSDFTDGGVHLDRSILSGNSLQFGSCESAKITCRIFYTDQSYIGKAFDAYVYLDSNPLYRIPLGRFIVTSDRPDERRKKKEIIAYDALYALQTMDIIDWYNGLRFPLSIRDMRISLMEHIGITAEQAVLINDAVLVEKTIDANELMAIEVLRSICELNAVYGTINRSGHFEYISIGRDHADVAGGKLRSLKYEDYTTDAITGIIIRQEENDIGASYGNESNAYIIQGNFLCYGKSETEMRQIAEAVYGAVKDIRFVPADYTMSSILLDPGDSVTITKGENTISTFALSISTDIATYIKDRISAKSSKEQPKATKGIRHQVEQLRGRSNVLERNINETRSTISDVERGLRSEITQTADGIQAQIAELQKEIDGDITVYTGDYVPTLENYPAWDWTYNITMDGTVQFTEDLHFEYKDEWWQKHARTIFFDESTGITYRFSKENGIWGWYPTKNTEFDYVISKITELEVRADGVDVTTSEIRQTLHDDYVTNTSAQSMISTSASQIMTSVSADYVTKSLASDTYYTKTSASSQFKQTNDAISAEVTRATKAETSLSGTITSTRQDLTAQITQTADSLTSTINAKVAETQTYADGKASTAESNAKADTTAKLKSYSTTTEMNSAIKQSADSISASVSKQITETRTYADGKAATAESNAKADTTAKLKSYSTTTQMNSAIKAATDSITLSVSQQITDTRTYADGKASTAEANAKADTADKLKSYSTTTQMNAAIKASADSITLAVSKTYATQSSLSTLSSTLSTNYYTKAQTNARIDMQTDSIKSAVFARDDTYRYTGTKAIKTYGDVPAQYYGFIDDPQAGDLYLDVSSGDLYEAYWNSGTAQMAWKVKETLTKNTDYYDSEFTQTASQISAKVSQTGGSNKTFGWSLTSSAFVLQANSAEVFRCDKSGITVNGYTKTKDLSAEVATFGYTKTSELSAKVAALGYVTASQVKAEYVETVDFNALSARVDTISANYVSTNYLSSNYATIGSLNAATGRISSLESSAITTGNLSANIANLSGVNIKSLNCSSQIVNYGDRSYLLTPIRIYASGAYWIVMGAQYTV